MARSFLTLFGHVDAHLAAGDQHPGDRVDFGAHGAGGHGDLPGVQGHVAGLDALGGQRPQRGQVLGEADADGDGRQVPGGRHAEHLQARLRRGVTAGRPADGAEGKRQGERPGEIAGIVDGPRAERSIATVARGVGVRAGLGGAPVVAGGDHDRVDPVHDALVVRGGAVGVDGRQRCGLGDAPGDEGTGHTVTLDRRRRHPAARPRHAPVGEVGQDAQHHASACEAGDERRDRLTDRVDGVGAHGVAGVDDDVGDEHRTRERVDHPHLEFAKAAAQLDQQRITFVADAADLVDVLRISSRACAGSGTRTNWICAIISAPDIEVMKPQAS